MTPYEFIARLASLVPHPREHQLTYQGVLAPASPRSSIQGDDVIPRPVRRAEPADARVPGAAVIPEYGAEGAGGLDWGSRGVGEGVAVDSANRAPGSSADCQLGVPIRPTAMRTAEHVLPKHPLQKLRPRDVGLAACLLGPALRAVDADPISGIRALPFSGAWHHQVTERRRRCQHPMVRQLMFAGVRSVTARATAASSRPS